MSSEARIQIVVDQQGKIVIQAKGYRGATCQSATKALEEALGIATHRQATTDAYLQVADCSVNARHNGQEQSHE